MKKTKERINDKAQRILEGVAAWCSFYRENPQRFVKDYLNIKLKLFQKFLIFAMMHNNHFMFWACRSIGKTWLTGLFATVRCVLFPKTKICVSCFIREQGNEVLQKIVEDLMVNYGWGSENLKREILDWKIGATEAYIYFRNNSWIKVVTAKDTGRGKRANILILDEFRMLDKKVVDTVLKRFLGNPRHPQYLDLPEYKENEDLLESNVEIYMSSAWYRGHWSYDKSKAFTVNFLGGRDGYFVCALPYQMAIKEGLKKRSDIEDDMSESDFDELAFNMEMCCMPYGINDEAFFSFDAISDCRNLQSAIYPYAINGGKIEIPDLAPNERRILSADIALMASTKHKNDAASIFLNRSIPTNNYNYKANIVYTDNYEGLLTNELALEIRRLFDIFKCTDLVIDAQGNGAGVYDLLIQEMIDYKTGKVYPALSCCNNAEMAARCKEPNAPKVIWAIKASAGFNTDISKSLRVAIQNGNINFLVSEQETEENLKNTIKGFKRLPLQAQFDYKKPYINTDLMVRELVNLEGVINGREVKIKEKSGNRKDRYSSLAYNYWVQCELERENLRPQKKSFNLNDYAQKLSKLNVRPTIY